MHTSIGVSSVEFDHQNSVSSFGCGAFIPLGELQTRLQEVMSSSPELARTFQDTSAHAPTFRRRFIYD